MRNRAATEVEHKAELTQHLSSRSSEAQERDISAATEVQESRNRGAREAQELNISAPTEVQESCNRSAREAQELDISAATELQESCNRSASEAHEVVISEAGVMNSIDALSAGVWSARLSFPPPTLLPMKEAEFLPEIEMVPSSPGVDEGSEAAMPDMQQVAVILRRSLPPGMPASADGKAGVGIFFATDMQGFQTIHSLAPQGSAVMSGQVSCSLVFSCSLVCSRVVLCGVVVCGFEVCRLVVLSCLVLFSSCLVFFFSRKPVPAHAKARLGTVIDKFRAFLSSLIAFLM
jgi:hypothetical protein